MIEANTEYKDDLLKSVDSLQEAQERNNLARYRELRTLATPGFLKVFDLAPTLLHYNHPDLPGYLGHPDTPHGVVAYSKWEMQANEVPIGPWSDIVSDPVVECLVLIGSSGSVGHTVRSDLDYWVCYRHERLNGQSLGLFKEKLHAVSRWASEAHNTEANFYLVNLAELAKGRIDHSWGEEAEGEVAPHLLMEELYRTILFVAGRFPFWCVWPEGRTQEEYQEAAKVLAPLDWDNSPPTYVDLGFPTKPPPQEYLASAMWLAHKAETDPFKGVIKMVPILEAVETDFQSPLICDLVKSEITNNALSNFAVDPYIITIDRVAAFCSTHLSPEHAELARSASVLKVLGLTGKEGDQIQRTILSPSKLRVLTKWINDWGWPPDRLGHLAAYDQWTERERLSLGSDILMMLLGVYMRISSHLINRFPGQVNAQDEQLAPFAARILGRQRGLEATVDLLPSDLHRNSLSKRMVLQQDVLTGQWSLYNLKLGNNQALEAEPLAGLDPDSGDVIFQCERVAKAAAWLVRNQLYSPDLELTVTDSFGVTTEMVHSYLEALNSCFPPLEFYSLDPDTIFQVGAKGQILIAFNLEDPGETKIRAADIVFRTGWGEMRHQWRELGHMAVEADKYMDLSHTLIEVCGLTAVDSLILHPSQAETFTRAFNNLKSALMAQLRPKQQLKASKSLIDL
ncbi:MAG: class I adenylate cyclase [Deltaproteobacteria bacterium]|jgi:adenylate cyclase class 1|nr:class I adenylate cyclase [Deltaproteobacteria bacterium]